MPIFHQNYGTPLRALFPPKECDISRLTDCKKKKKNKKNYENSLRGEQLERIFNRPGSKN
jgi:hypothetical protein